MKSLLWVAVVALVLVGGYKMMYKGDGGYMSKETGTSTESSTQLTTLEGGDDKMMAPKAVVTLETQGTLGQSGTATFTQNAAGNLVVTLAMTGGTFTAPQPAHIHLGACPTSGAIKFDLANVVDGKSETVLDTTWAAVVAAGEKLALNVHKSGAEAKVYTACGDLPITGETEAMVGGDAKVTTPKVSY